MSVKDAIILLDIWVRSGGNRCSVWQGHERDPENITDAINTENAASISKIRSLFVNSGLTPAASEDAGSAVMSEESKDGEL